MGFVAITTLRRVPARPPDGHSAWYYLAVRRQRGALHGRRGLAGGQRARVAARRARRLVPRAPRLPHLLAAAVPARVPQDTCHLQTNAMGAIFLCVIIIMLAIGLSPFP